MQTQLVAESLGRLQEYFGRTLKPEIQAVYIKRLETLSEGQIKSAIVRVIDEFRPTSTNPFQLLTDILAYCCVS